MKTKKEAVKAITEYLVNNNINIEYCYNLLAKHLNANQITIRKHFNKCKIDENGNKWECDVIPQFYISDKKEISFRITYLLLVSSEKTKESDDRTYGDDDLKKTNNLVFNSHIKELINNIYSIHQWDVNGMPDISYQWNMGNIFTDYLFTEYGLAELRIVCDYDYWTLQQRGTIFDMEKCVNAMIQLINYRGIANRLLDFYYGDDFGDLETLLIVPQWDKVNNTALNNWDVYTSLPDIIKEWYHNDRWNIAQIKLIVHSNDGNNSWNRLQVNNIHFVLMDALELEKVTQYLFLDGVLTQQMKKDINLLTKID